MNTRMTYPPFHESSNDEPMLLSVAEFRDRFPTEGGLVERKNGLARKPIGEAVVAFSNADGGVILVGVADDGAIVGRELTGDVETQIHEIVANTHNPGRYHIHRLVVGEREITVISVGRRRQGFAQTSDGRVLVRRGARNVALVGDELHRLVSARLLGRFETTATQIPVARASAPRVDELASGYGWERPEGFTDRLIERGLVTQDLHVTVAGALLLLDDPKSVVGKAFVEILRYSGESVDYDQRVIVDGPIQHQIAVTSMRVAEALGSELVVLGIRRHELPRLPLVVIREAVANAVAHRSYEATGTPVRISLYPTEVVITSPGPLPEPVTVDNIRETQAARNPAIIDCLRRLNLAEDVGRGIDVIQDSMSAELLEPPRFEATDSFVTVRLPLRSPITPTERAWIRELEIVQKIAPMDRVLLVHAARGEELTNSRARELLGTEDAATARAALQRLRDAGVLVQRGTRGGAAYVLGKIAAPPVAVRLSPSEIFDLVVDLASNKPIQNSDVREATGLDRVEALRVLSTLVDEGRLERTGVKRGTYYVSRGS